MSLGTPPSWPSGPSWPSNDQVVTALLRYCKANKWRPDPSVATGYCLGLTSLWLFAIAQAGARGENELRDALNLLVYSAPNAVAHQAKVPLSRRSDALMTVEYVANALQWLQQAHTILDVTQLNPLDHEPSLRCLHRTAGCGTSREWARRMFERERPSLPHRCMALLRTREHGCGVIKLGDGIRYTIRTTKPDRAAAITHAIYKTPSRPPWSTRSGLRPASQAVSPSQ